MTSTIPSTMEAAIRTGWTGYTIDFDDKYPTPTLPNHPDKTLIKVHAAALNPVDYKLPKQILGSVYGMDVCGTIVQLPSNYNAGSDADNGKLKVGDVVLGPTVIGWSGALAGYTTVYASKVTKLPDHWSPEEGASLPVACATAMEGFQQAGLVHVEGTTIAVAAELPKSLLVIGASGGCGLLALQLAKGMGEISRIIGICSSKNADLCRENGATEVVPYDDKEQMEAFLRDNVGKIDVIYDAASYSGGVGEEYCDNPQVLALLSTPDDEDAANDNAAKHKKSSYIALNGSMTAKVKAATLQLALGFKFQQSLVVLPQFHASALKLGMELLDKAGLKPIIDTSHSFTKAGVQEAYTKLKSRRAKGKIVISISKPEEERN